MKNKKLFEKSVQILSDAYFKDALKAQSCKACAVGNLIEGNGYKLIQGYSITAEVACKDNSCEHWLRYIGVYCRDEIPTKKWLNEELGLEQIKATGYTSQELNLVELAFERAEKVSDDLMFDRLMAVVEVLQQIHECSEEDTVKAKGKFNKQLKLEEI